MEKIVKQTLLFDFYGELLTEHQQKIYEEVVVNDTGYSEVAAMEGVSRQGVHDLVRRCDHQLDAYEKKLHLVERFLKIRDHVRRIRSLAEQMKQQGEAEGEADEMLRLTQEILEEL